jgi:hypothetical protein
MNAEPCNTCIGTSEIEGAKHTKWRPATREEKISNPGAYVVPEPSALDVQVAGDHYKKLKIQPVEYIHANNIPFIEGCIIKYATRWRDKGGVKDLEKIKHFADLLIELESKNDTK